MSGMFSILSSKEKYDVGNKLFVIILYGHSN